MARPPISSCLKRVRCPVHGLVRPPQRRHASGITPAEVKALIPTMKDSVVWKWDQVTMAMSGGVDSAVALRILSEWPVDLNVIFMRNWDSLLSESAEDQVETSYAYSADPSSSKGPNMSPCGWQKDWESVQRVCAHVGIPEHRVRLVDLSREYWTRVFEPAINVWQEGGTPNPDVACNREIKFGALLEHVPMTNRSFLATGHYARVKRVPHATRLCRADDMTKDQSYYLSAITEAQLRRALFPLAGIKKEDTRRLARYYGLPNAEKEESMGLCFVGERGKFGNFVSQYVDKPAEQGYLVDQEGKRLAPHNGLWHYTIGQRARIAGQLEPMFVAKKCTGDSGQDIMVVPGGDHPALMCTRLHTHDFHWIAGKVPKGMVPGGKKRATVQLRHRMEAVPAVISHDWNGAGLTIDLLEPVQGVAIGQVCAIYYLDWCIGSGIIKQTWTADTHPVKRYRNIKQAKGHPEEYYGAEESGRLDVEEIEEDAEGENAESVALPQPVTVYAEKAEPEGVDGSAVVEDRSSASSVDHAATHTTANEFWLSDEPTPAASPNRPIPPATSPRDAKIRPAFGTYAVSRTPHIKGFGAPRGYAPWTAFGSIVKELRRQVQNPPNEALGLSAPVSEGWKVVRESERRNAALSGETQRAEAASGQSGLSSVRSDARPHAEEIKVRRPSKAGLPRGPAMELSERRSAQRGFGVAGSKITLQDRPLAFEAREGIRQERVERRTEERGRYVEKRSSVPDWEKRGRKNPRRTAFGYDPTTESADRPRTRGRGSGRGEFGGGDRPARSGGFGMRGSMQ